MTAALLCTVACDGDADEQPSSCDPAARVGTYFATFDVISGDCGDQASGLIRVGGDANAASGCRLIAQDRWSDGNCTLERSMQCPFDEFERGATIETIAITTQRDEDGDRMTGTMTMTVWEASGQAVCLGTYRMVAERQ